MSDKELADKLEQLAADVREFGKEGARDRWKYGFSPNGEKPRFDNFFVRPDKYHRKPDTIDINGHTVKLGMREEPEKGQLVHVADPTLMHHHYSFRWQGDYIQRYLLEHGLIHTTPEAAAKHGEALASFTRRGE